MALSDNILHAFEQATCSYCCIDHACRDEQNQRDEDAVIRFLLKYIIENQQQHKETV